MERVQWRRYYCGKPIDWGIREAYSPEEHAAWARFRKRRRRRTRMEKLSRRVNRARARSRGRKRR